MTPFFAKEQMNIINARAEGDKNSRNDPGYNGSKSIFLKTAFMKPMQAQRCLVIADAYYEWSNQKKPHLIFLQNWDRPFAFAGIYDHLSDVLRLLAPYPSEKMNDHPVSEMVNIQGVNFPEMLNPVGERLKFEINPVRFGSAYRTHKEKGSSGVPWFGENKNE
jgi:hypothetical protein